MGVDESRRAGWAASNWLNGLGAVLFLIAGVPLVWGGAVLVGEGGSFYYLLAGLALVGVAVLLWRGSRAAIWLYVAILAATIVWALAEAGMSVWDLLPRISGPAVLGLWFAIPAVRKRLVSGPRWPGEAWATPALFVIALALLLASFWQARFHPVAGERSTIAVSGDPTSWTAFGADHTGKRFTTANLITPENVAGLKPAWTFETGETPPDVMSHGSSEFQSIPLKIGDGLYICTPNNTVIAIDPDTGKQIWRTKPEIDFKDRSVRRCRGLTYYGEPGEEICSQRLIMGTIDSQLIALDVRTGKPCPGFGENGYVDITPGLGRNPPGFHFVSSPPTIVGDVAVVGSSVYDNQTTDAVPGVIRAYDVNTGELRWAWDVVNPAPAALPEPGESYVRGGPNMWGVASADEELGLVFVPTGNPANDYYGGQRSKEIERYGSGVAALDAATGAMRWNYQMTRHDVWDYDVASQPVLVDFPTPDGTVAAVLAPTKRGEIFVLDRRTGKPLTRVEERKVPQGAPEGDWLSPTQPFNVEFPSFRPSEMDETSMWGATPYDQMWCRIAFHQLRYEGLFTPGSTKGAIHDPGAAGVMNWGSISVDPSRRIAIVNATWMPFVDTLIPRKIADAAGMTAYGDPPAKATGGPVPAFSKYSWAFPQMKTPYAIDTSPFVSPLGFPCRQPPWGLLAAVDLDSRKVLWQRPFGTTRGSAPLGISLPTGVPNHGGSITTGGGVTFIAAALDGYIRAFETVTGRELWKADLPAGGQSTPISYVSGKTGKQYVVMTVGGSGTYGTAKGDYVVAYALPGG